VKDPHTKVRPTVSGRITPKLWWVYCDEGGDPVPFLVHAWTFNFPRDC